MAEKNKNLNLARAAIREKDLKKAQGYYEMVLEEMPENLEAEWFYRFVLVAEQINDQTAKNYKRLAEIFYPTLKYIATLQESEEKNTLAYYMIKGFPPLKDILKEKMLQIMSMDRTAISTEDYVAISLPIGMDKKQLAAKIIEIFGEENPYCKWVADIWKEVIAERFQWSNYRNFQDRGKELWFDELAKKIKKYDPSYEMPQFKQAGCISTGDAGKVKPGE